jgi:hypothetical protein
MVVAFQLVLGFCFVPFLCSNQFVTGIDYYTCRKDFGLLKVNFIHSIMGHRTGRIFATPGV